MVLRISTCDAEVLACSMALKTRGQLPNLEICEFFSNETPRYLVKITEAFCYILPDLLQLAPILSKCR